jgi:rhodanese-related sulfurtransferase/CBS domain-containing protein
VNAETVAQVVDTSRTRELLAAGAQLVEVLPAETYAEEHIAGAISIPLESIDRAVEQLDQRRPVIVYCYDYQCDLSPRAACRLEQLGFDPVYDYVAGKAAWLADGLASEGLVRDDERAGAAARTDVPTVGAEATLGDAAALIGDWELVVVIGADDVVVGVVRAEATGGPSDTEVAAVMQTAPSTVRPSITVRELAKNMDQDGRQHLLVTTLGGRLIGLVRREDLGG